MHTQIIFNQCVSLLYGLKNNYIVEIKFHQYNINEEHYNKNDSNRNAGDILHQSVFWKRTIVHQ